MMRKIAKNLEKLIDGKIGAPVIIETVEKEGEEIRPILSRFKLKAKQLRLFNMFSCFLPLRIIDEIADLPTVQKIYFDAPIYLPEMPKYINFTDLFFRNRLLGFGNIGDIITMNQSTWIPTSISKQSIGADIANHEGYTGKDVNVCVIDTDSSYRAIRHRQFYGKTVQSASIRLKYQTDTNGHGSHVATTIAGISYSPFPNITVEGVAPDANLLMIKALFTPMGAGSTSDCIDALGLAFIQGIDVVNLSLGMDFEQPIDDPFQIAINRLPKDKIIVVAAAGNDGLDRVNSPANAENALAIGAYDVKTNEVAGFSNRGEGLDFIMPGVNIFSGICRETLLDVTGGLPEGFSMLSGTSMATPHATGMVAIAIQMMKEHGIKPTVDTFREIGRRYGESHSFERGYGPLTYDMIKQYVSE